MNKSFKITLALTLLLLVGASLFGALKKDPKGVVGKIGTKTLTYAEYNQILENYFDFWSKRDGKALTPDRKKTLNEQCWNEQIGVYLYDREIKKRGLSISDAEAYNAAITNTPADVKRIQALIVNGKFSLDKFKEAMEKDAKFKENVLTYMKNSMKYDKLLNAVRAEASFKPDSVKIAWQTNNDTFSGKIIVFDQSKVTPPSISDDEAREYYNTNYETYKREPSRKYKYVKFTTSITAADSAYAKVKADSLYEALKAGADFAKLAEQFSADPGSAKKGGVYDWFDKKRMVKPFSDAAFGMAINEISQPVKTQFGWHIIQTLEKRNAGAENEEVRARHILIKPETNPQTIAKNKADAEYIYTLALVMGLTEAAKYAGYNTETTPEFFATAKSIPGLGNFPDLVTKAFKNKVGYINNPLNGQRGDMYVTQSTDSLDVHYAPFDTEKGNIITKIQAEKKIAINLENAKAFYAKHAGTDMLAAAAADSMKITDVKDIKKGNILGDIRNAAPVVDSLLALESGQYSQVLEHEKNAYIGYVEKRTKPDMKVWDKDKSKILKEAKADVQKRYLDSWYAQKRTDLKPEDNRKDYYELEAPKGSGQPIQIKAQ